jgi:hypothetical protein
LNCSWAGVTGQLTIASDELERLPPDRLDILKRVMPAHGQLARPVDLFDRDLPRAWVIPSAGVLDRQTVVGLFNFEATPVEVVEPLPRFGLDADQDYVAFEYWTNRPLGIVRGELRYALASMGTAASLSEEKSSGKVERSAAVIALVALSDRPEFVSSSRHVSQGRVDVEALSWDEGTGTLRGTSRLVAGDLYELRFLTRGTSRRWRLESFELDPPSEPTATAGLGSSDDWIARSTILSPTSRSLSWKARFVPVLEGK